MYPRIIFVYSSRPRSVLFGAPFGFPDCPLTQGMAHSLYFTDFTLPQGTNVVAV